MKNDTAELAADIVDFWKKAGPEKWFDKDAAFDNRFHDRFRDAHFAAARRELDNWLEDAESSLALMLLLDQFPRNPNGKIDRVALAAAYSALEHGA